MTDRICPKCTSALTVRVVNRNHDELGWECLTCGLTWAELAKVASAASAPRAANPIRGGRVE